MEPQLLPASAGGSPRSWVSLIQAPFKLLPLHWLLEQVRSCVQSTLRVESWFPKALTPVFLPGKSHGQRSLAGYSPWGCKESNHLVSWYLYYYLVKQSKLRQIVFSIRALRFSKEYNWCSLKSLLLAKRSKKTVPFPYIIALGFFPWATPQMNSENTELSIFCSVIQWDSPLLWHYLKAAKMAVYGLWH